MQGLLQVRKSNFVTEAIIHYLHLIYLSFAVFSIH